MLQANDLRFGYSGREILKGVSFEARAGELITVLGPNGSGKSTLLKILVRILNPSSGEVFLEQRRLNEYSRTESARLIGYVAQETSILFPLTAIEFVLQGRFARGRFSGFETDEDEAAARWAMEVTETLEFASRKVNELSGENVNE